MTIGNTIGTQPAFPWPVHSFSSCFECDAKRSQLIPSLKTCSHQGRKLAGEIATHPAFCCWPPMTDCHGLQKATEFLSPPPPPPLPSLEQVRAWLLLRSHSCSALPLLILILSLLYRIFFFLKSTSSINPMYLHVCFSLLTSLKTRIKFFDFKPHTFSYSNNSEIRTYLHNHCWLS